VYDNTVFSIQRRQIWRRREASKLYHFPAL